MERLLAQGPAMSAEQLVDASLDLVGPVEVSSTRRDELVSHVQRDGEIRCSTNEEKRDFEKRATALLQLIVSSREFQFA